MLGYRSFVTVENQRDEVVKCALEQLHSWLRWKKYDSDTLRPQSTAALAEGVDGLLVEQQFQDGSRWVRARVVERTSTGRWISELSVGVPGRASQAPWVWLDIASPEPINVSGGDPRRLWTATPRLARHLAEVFVARDGQGVLGPTPSRVSADGVEALIDVIRDQDRRGLIFIAGSDSRMPLEPWARHVSKLMKDTVGLAAAYVLDPDATDGLNAALGNSHGVPPWTIRTFRPGADPSSSVDGLKHRILSLDRITEADDLKIARMFGWRARDAALQSPLSTSVMRVNRQLERAIDDLLLKRLARAEERSVRSLPLLPDEPAPVTVEDATEQLVDGKLSAQSVMPEVENFLALSAVMADVIGEATVSVRTIELLGQLARVGQNAEANQAAIAERLGALGDQADRLTVERDHLRLRLEEEQLDHAETTDDRVRAEEQVRHLRKLLLESNRVADAWTEPEEAGARPTSYRELLEQLRELVYVVFTGNADVLLDLEEHDPLFTWGGKIWDALCALEDYGRSTAEGRCSRDVDGYLRHLPDGCRGYSANRHARDESEDVRRKDQFRRVRVLPVPVDVASEGEVFMGAHFKIAQSGLISPRLHYFDDSAGSRKVYIGYIGPHLRTKQTN